MSTTVTRTLASDPPGIAEAVELLNQGRLVAFPTETVYGLGGDARDTDAVAGIFAAKNRPAFNPLIAHVTNAQAAERHVVWNDLAERLANAFWPGPLTLVLPLRVGHGISPLVTAGLETLAIRAPAHPAAQALLGAFDAPVAAPSANPSGRISPTSAAHVLAGLSGRISAVLDDGPCTVGLESTIVGLVGKPTLLRPGGLAREDIERVLGLPLGLRSQNEALNAPGQILSHYAPKGLVRLNATSAQTGETLLGFGDIDGDLNLSETGDLAEAAANLFAYFHRLDARNQTIAVAPIPNTGLGQAINDRLQRAAAPRDSGRL